MKFLVNDILEATSGKLIIQNDLSGQFSISTDTRTITKENIFLPIVGANFDGHNFINTALEKGCKAFFVDKNNLDKLDRTNKDVFFAIEVENTLEAYLKMANFVRKKLNPKVVAITGSSGKTTTKEMIASVLSVKFKTHKSKLNHNNEIGLCQTILTMPEDTEFLVIEMGMRALGEIELLSQYATPDFAVITNVGTAHIGRLGSTENIAKAKCEIAKYLKPEGVFISHNSDLVKNELSWHGSTIYYSFEDKNLSKIETKEESVEFLYKGNKYGLNVSGEYNVTNALASIEIGLLASMTPEEIKKGLLDYRPIDNRWQITPVSENRKIINDSYNANPDSVKASINAVIEAYSDYKIYLVLGDMGELGDYEESLHREIGYFLNNKSVYQLITVGKKAKLIADSVNNNIKINTFTNNDEVVEYLRDNFEKDSIVLIKASRSMCFDCIVKDFLGV